MGKEDREAQVSRIRCVIRESTFISSEMIEDKVVHRVIIREDTMINSSRPCLIGIETQMPTGVEV